MTLATTLAGVAVAVSLVAAWVSLHAQREVIRSETVTAVFEGFRRVTELRIASWQVAHVLETPENYERTVAVLRTALADTPPAQVAELLIRERAVAIAAVQIFEESVYQYEHAKATPRSGTDRLPRGRAGLLHRASVLESAAALAMETEWGEHAG